MAIFVLTMTTATTLPITLPLAHACGAINMPQIILVSMKCQGFTQFGGGGGELVCYVCPFTFQAPPPQTESLETAHVSSSKPWQALRVALELNEALLKPVLVIEAMIKGKAL
jgi:hypothetical protein